MYVIRSLFAKHLFFHIYILALVNNDINRDGDDEEIEDNEDVFNEENVIKFYFDRGFTYEEILAFLDKYHNHQISYSTLLRRLKEYNLSRRNKCKNSSLDYVRSCIKSLVDGPESCGGYRTIWHSLEMKGMRVPRSIIQSMLKIN